MQKPLRLVTNIKICSLHNLLGSVILARNTSNMIGTTLAECYEILNLPLGSKQNAVRRAFLELAKRYHPDSGSPEANIDKFVLVENAFRTLTKHNTGKSNNEEIESIVHDIKHTAPQHRQYLSYEGLGHGTPSQREKQWAQARAQKAAINVMEYRIAKSVASETTLLKKGQYGKKHDIKTKYGIDRLVEDLIQESISKGEFENLSGKGKPLKNQNTNPYVDFTTHKLNEVLINNGFTPEWITMAKEIDHDVELLKRDIGNDRKYLGPYPLDEEDEAKWHHICEQNKDIVKTINSKINKYNLIVPLINRQKFYVEIDKILDEILKSGKHSVMCTRKHEKMPLESETKLTTYNDDLISNFLRAFEEIFTYKDKKDTSK